ncbi:hypothetical protein CO676_27055 [Sinorhizobium sp. BJ1]|nr:hypothetical protein CO676_27055 [Sinorhizobium sp. BJ1]
MLNQLEYQHFDLLSQRLAACDDDKSGEPLDREVVGCAIDAFIDVVGYRQRIPVDSLHLTADFVDTHPATS